MGIKLISIIFISFNLIQIINCAKILGIFTFPSRSHSILIETITTELVKHDHELTVITNFPLMEKMENYTEIIISPPYDYWKTVKDKFALENMKFTQMINMMETMGLETTEYALKNEKVQEFIKNDQTKFDLIILEQYYQEAFLVLADKYKVPIITLSTFGIGNHINAMMGGFNPLSHVPHELLVFDKQMNFFERLNNVYFSLYEYYSRNFYYLPKMNGLAIKYITNNQHDSGTRISNLEKNISLVLVNTNFALTPSRPLVPTIIPIGGCHIKSPKTLPRDIRQFLDEAIYGAIYFSLGTNLQSSELPEDKLEILLKTFSKMKQKILWKYENKKLKNLPKNVMIKSWMPQSDILAHPHVRVFITHGGILSVQEGIFRAVPMLGFPIFIDQQINMNKAVQGGYAISFKLTNLTEESLNWALTELFQNRNYTEKITLMSKKFRDRPIRALEEVIYWIEYVLRFKNVNHLRSTALDITWIQYFLIDIFAFILLFIFLIIFSIFLTVKLIKMRKKTKKIDKKSV